MAKILAVDDTKFARNRTVKPLEAMGHEVIQAENGQQGFEKFLTEKPDLVVSDLLMPIIDGIEQLRKIREAGYLTPVIIVSADIQSTSRDQCFQLGVSDFLNKPFEESKLLEVVNKALGKSEVIA